LKKQGRRKVKTKGYTSTDTPKEGIVGVQQIWGVREGSTNHQKISPKWGTRTHHQKNNRTGSKKKIKTGKIPNPRTWSTKLKSVRVGGLWESVTRTQDASIIGKENR